jgi:glycine/D-amino acid oxidase-like deaminating enzyme
MPATVPLWLEDPAPERPPLDGPARAEACVVGAGIGGLATAWKLLDRGIRPLILEARTVAGGASGRNGGFFIAGPAPMYHDARARWGAERTVAIQRATLAAQAEMLGVAAAVGAREHFRMDGMLRLGIDAQEARDVRVHHAALRADGFAGELLEGDDLPEVLRRPQRAGLLLPHDGTVHPVRWLRALAAELERRGAVICERTQVTGPPAVAGAGVRVATDRGEVSAGVAVVAVDGGLAALVPAAAAVRSRRLNMLATAPTGPRLPYPVYARYGHEYAQQTADGRITLGGFSDLDAEASWTDREEVSEPVQRRLDIYLREELAVGAPVTHRWVGLVGYGEDALPRCGPVPGSDGRVLALGGYNGTGHIQAWVAAEAVAAHVAGSPAEALYAPV